MYHIVLIDIVIIIQLLVEVVECCWDGTIGEFPDILQETLGSSGIFPSSLTDKRGKAVYTARLRKIGGLNQGDSE